MQVHYYDRIKNLLENTNNPIIFECGVHQAEHTLILMNVCNTKPLYYAFEPDKRNIKTILENVPTLKYPLNFIQAAVSNKTGESDFYESDGICPSNGVNLTGASSLKQPKELTKTHDWIKFQSNYKVKTYRLDDFCKENQVPYIDFIWCDIQGLEYEMMEGLGDFLKNVNQMFFEYSIIESYQGEKTLDEILKFLGNDWEVVEKYDFDILVRNKNFVRK